MTKTELAKELVGKAKAGDKSAFGELYAEYSEQIKRFVMKMNITELDAEDIVADTFAEAMEHIEDLENDSAFSTWLHSIAKRKVYAKTGREQRHGRVSFNSADDDMQNDELDILATEAADFNCDDSVKLPHDYAENEEIKQILADTVNELKPEHRDSIFMFYYENKSLNEIAEEMNVPVGTVKSRLNNGRKALSKKCEALIKKGYAFSFVPIPVLLGVLVKESKLKAAGAVTSTATASTMAGGAASGAAVSAISGKIGAVIAAAVMIGAGTGVYFHYSRNADKIHKKPKLSDSSIVDSSKQLPDSNNDWNPDLRKYQQRDVRVVDEAESEVEVNETPIPEESSVAETPPPTEIIQQTPENNVPIQQTITFEDEPNEDEPNNDNTETNNNNTSEESNYEDYSYLKYENYSIGNEEGIIINGFSNETYQRFEMPESIEGKPVIAINNLAFFESTYLNSIVLPSKCISIGNSAFEGCFRLITVNFNNNLISIGDRAFYNCTSLTNVTIPNSVTEIGTSAFYMCEYLQTISLSNSISKINDNTFEGCKSLKDITIPNGVKSIGNEAFNNCTSLTNIIVPNSVTVF